MRYGDLAPNTIRNAFRFLRRVYGWARVHKRKTGVTVNPFGDDLDTAVRRRLFPSGVAKKASPFTRDQLRQLTDLLPAYAARPVLFGALTGLRWQSELLRMQWGRVDLDRRSYTVDPRYAKRGKEREVPLSDAALAILKLIRPPKPGDADPVWLGPEGGPLQDVRSVYAARVRKVCPEPRAGWRYPDLHSLRRTCATALEQVSSLGVTAKVLGHSPGGVTALYVQPSFDDCLAALNRAARLIHGDPEPANVVPLKRKVTAS